MNLNTSAGRRVAAGLVAAGAAILIPATALASPAAPATSAHPAMCSSASTGLRLAVANSAAGTAFVQLRFRNIGRHTCTLFGYPGVSPANSHGRQIGVPASHSGSRHTVTLKPGAVAHALLSAKEPTCTHPVMPSRLKVFPPGQTHVKLVKFSFPVCKHRVTMNVGPVRPGKGAL
jgi:hypothetical protein